jgi:putative transposase
MEWFRNRIEAKVVREIWRRHYNQVRPYSSLKNLPPFACGFQCGSVAA